MVTFCIAGRRRFRSFGTPTTIKRTGIAARIGSGGPVLERLAVAERKQRKPSSMARGVEALEHIKNVRRDMMATEWGVEQSVEVYLVWRNGAAAHGREAGFLPADASVSPPHIRPRLRKILSLARAAPTIRAAVTRNAAHVSVQS